MKVWEEPAGILNDINWNLEKSVFKTSSASITRRFDLEAVFLGEQASANVMALHEKLALRQTQRELKSEARKEAQELVAVK